MTDRLDLDVIAARCAAATPGPWSLDPLKGKYYGTTVRTGTAMGVTVWGHRLGQISPREEWFEDVMCDGHYEDLGDYSLAVFIANARTDVPLLLDEVARLTDSDAAREAALTHLQGLVRAFQQADADYTAQNTFHNGTSVEWTEARSARNAALQALAAYEAPHA